MQHDKQIFLSFEFPDGSTGVQQGCYVDMAPDRDLSVQVDMSQYETVTPVLCLQECMSRNKTYGALQVQ